MDYKAEIKEIFDKVYKEGYDTGFTEGVKAKFDKSEEKEEEIKEEKPYMIETITIQKKKYNPNYGDDRMCICGHTYYRHFDPWEDMETVGCKYCGCQEFIEVKREDEE